MKNSKQLFQEVKDRAAQVNRVGLRETLYQMGLRGNEVVSAAVNLRDLSEAQERDGETPAQRQLGEFLAREARELVHRFEHLAVA